MFILQFAEAINVGLNEIKPKARIPKNYDLIKYFAERFKLRLTKVLENLKDLINEWQSDTGVDTFIDGFTRSITEGLGANEHPPITRCPVFGQPIFRVNNSDGRVYQEPSNNEIKIYENPNSPWGMIVRGLKSINKSLMDNMETQGKRYEIRETLRGLDYKVFSSFLDTLQEMMNGY